MRLAVLAMMCISVSCQRGHPLISNITRTEPSKTAIMYSVPGMLSWSDFLAPSWNWLVAAAGSPAACRLKWQQVSMEHCPYGHRLPGDVTWPEGDIPRKDSWFFLYLSVFYSYVPYIFGLLLTINFLIHRGTRELQFLLFILFLVFCNEVLIKPFVHYPRPEYSCLYTCGMLR